MDFTKSAEEPSEGSNAWLRKWAEYITEQADQETRFNNEYVDKQIAQAELASAQSSGQEGRQRTHHKA